MKTDTSTPAFQYTDGRYATTGIREREDTISALDDELYVLNKYSDLSPLFHLISDSVNMEIDSYRVTSGSIVSHKFSEDSLGRRACSTSPAGMN